MICCGNHVQSSILEPTESFPVTVVTKLLSFSPSCHRAPSSTKTRPFYQFYRIVSRPDFWSLIVNQYRCKSKGKYIVLGVLTSSNCEVPVIQLLISPILSSMSWLWEKSGTWRWVVMNSKYNKGFFFAFTTLCFMGSWALGEAVMRTTNMSQIALDEELRRRARPDSMMVGQVNKDRLRQLLEEVQRKENTEDRYAAALRGETLTGTPGARVRGGAGTSMQSSSSQPEKIAVSLQTGQTVKDTKVPATTTS